MHCSRFSSRIYYNHKNVSESFQSSLDHISDSVLKKKIQRKLTIFLEDLTSCSENKACLSFPPPPPDARFRL